MQMQELARRTNILRKAMRAKSEDGTVEEKRKMQATKGALKRDVQFCVAPLQLRIILRIFACDLIEQSVDGHTHITNASIPRLQLVAACVKF
jgi:hypothetical protein